MDCSSEHVNVNAMDTDKHDYLQELTEIDDKLCEAIRQMTEQFNLFVSKK